MGVRKMRWLGLVVLTVFVAGGIGKKSRNTDKKDYSKILEEYLLRNFDGGSRGGSREIEVEEEEEGSGVGRADEDVIIEVGNSDEESEIEESTDEESTDEESTNEESVIVESTDEDSDIENEDIEIGSGVGEEESTILNSAPYTMESIDGSTSVNIILQQLSSSDLLNMVCDVSSENSDMFSEDNCVPQLYLVSGVSSCNSLPAEFSAKKLADVHGEGL